MPFSPRIAAKSRCSWASAAAVSEDGSASSSPSVITQPPGATGAKWSYVKPQVVCKADRSGSDAAVVSVPARSRSGDGGAPHGKCTPDTSVVAAVPMTGPKVSHDSPHTERHRDESSPALSQQLAPVASPRSDPRQGVTKSPSREPLP